MGEGLGSVLRAERAVRDLTRQRAQIMDDRTRISNRIKKVLEDAKVKLGSVASNVVGCSGGLMLEAIIEGQGAPAKLANLAQSSLRSGNWSRRFSGRLSRHLRWMLRLLMDQLASNEALPARPESILANARALLGPSWRLDEIPGIDVRVAQVLLTEIGPDMTRFPAMRTWPPGRHIPRQR